MGYGDLGCYGHPQIRTPNIGRLAAEGARLTSDYAAASVCTPSRVGLLTGRYPIRAKQPNNFGPDSKEGLQVEPGFVAAGAETAWLSHNGDRQMASRAWLR